MRSSISTPAGRIRPWTTPTSGKTGAPHGIFPEGLPQHHPPKFLNQVDALVDFPAGGAFPNVDFVYIENDGRLWGALGSPWLYRPRELYPGTASRVTSGRNVPSVVV